MAHINLAVQYANEEHGKYAPSWNGSPWHIAYQSACRATIWCEMRRIAYTDARDAVAKMNAAETITVRPE